MKKSLLKIKINEISKYLKSEKALDAVGILIQELTSYEEPQEKSIDTSSLPLPNEVRSKTNAYALYTDGACRGNPGPGSYAFIVQNHEGEIVGQGAEAVSLTTNNKMEMSAIINGLKFLSTEVSPMNEIYIFTDSKYVVDGMRSWIHNWKKKGWKKADNKAPENVDLWKELDSLSNICHMSFNWIKGHAGHPQNEHVDKMANVVLDENGY
ncbi:MAG: ribonuclease HI [Bacteriovoracaceae bacterium]|jgi:ribonuclease HI